MTSKNQDEKDQDFVPASRCRDEELSKNVMAVEASRTILRLLVNHIEGGALPVTDFVTVAQGSLAYSLCYPIACVPVDFLHSPN